MDKEKAKALSKTLACYKELQENNSVNLIEFHTADGQKHGIGNPEAIKLLLSVAVIELERQLRTAQFGDIPESLENSREYKAAKQLEYAMNDLGFKSERFAQALPYFHKTLEQTFFRTVKASITAMAGRDSRCIDDRNRASYEMCQMLASMLEDSRLATVLHTRCVKCWPPCWKIPVCPLSKCHVHRREDTKPPPCRAGREYLPRHDAHAGPDSGVLGRYP